MDSDYNTTNSAASCHLVSVDLGRAMTWITLLQTLRLIMNNEAELVRVFKEDQKIHCISI